MNPLPLVYQKLVGWRGGVGSRFSLWLRPDHVLLVEANMMTERYQRVWLRDLQGFLVRPSREAVWAVCVGAGLVLLFGVIALVSAGSTAAVCWTLTAMSASVLLFGLISARTHHFYAVTAVQRTEWPNVARRRHVRKVLARLEPLVREAQREEMLAAAGELKGTNGVGGEPADGAAGVSGNP
jgi:hypothetical protein